MSSTYWVGRAVEPCINRSGFVNNLLFPEIRPCIFHIVGNAAEILLFVSLKTQVLRWLSFSAGCAHVFVHSLSSAKLLLYLVAWGVECSASVNPRYEPHATVCAAVSYGAESSELWRRSFRLRDGGFRK